MSHFPHHRLNVTPIWLLYCCSSRGQRPCGAALKKTRFFFVWHTFGPYWIFLPRYKGFIHPGTSYLLFKAANGIRGQGKYRISTALYSHNSGWPYFWWNFELFFKLRADRNPRGDKRFAIVLLWRRQKSLNFRHCNKDGRQLRTWMKRLYFISILH